MKMGFIPMSICLGAILEVVHVAVALGKRRKPTLQEAVGCFLSAFGLVGGVCLFLGEIHPSLKVDVGDAWPYRAIGGLAVIWVSFQSLIRHFQFTKSRETVDTTVQGSMAKGEAKRKEG